MVSTAIIGKEEGTEILNSNVVFLLPTVIVKLVRDKRKLIKNFPLSPGLCGSGDSVLACEPKGRWFTSQPGHMPGLEIGGPSGGA